jgi:hypothetical protein
VTTDQGKFKLQLDDEARACTRLPAGREGHTWDTRNSLTNGFLREPDQVSP